MLGHPNSTLDLTDFPSSPIHEEEGQWYFWNEVYADREGPYSTRKEAVQRLASYCFFYLDGGYKNDEADPIFKYSFYIPHLLYTEVQWFYLSKDGYSVGPFKNYGEARTQWRLYGEFLKQTKANLTPTGHTFNNCVIEVYVALRKERECDMWE